MPSPKVRVDHDVLGGIARSFGQAADVTNKTLQQLKGATDVLRGGDWIGQGATKFYQEMDSAVLPAVQRLTLALAEGAKVTNQISQLMKQAEEEAARFLRGDGTGGGGASGGTPGTAGGGGGTAGKADPRAEAVKKFIDKGDKQGAIDESIKQYGIDVSQVNGKPTYNSATKGEGATAPNRKVSIGDAAYSSPGWLASSVGHESLHARQAAEGRWYTDPQGDAMNEVECYDWEIKNAPSNGLSAAEVKDLASRRKSYYDTLNATNKKQIDSGKYTKP
jgi:WXG100 family type VII secretion target